MGPVSFWVSGHGLCHLCKPPLSLALLRHFSSEFKVSQGGHQAPEGWEGGRNEQVLMRVHIPPQTLISLSKPSWGSATEAEGSLGHGTGRVGPPYAQAQLGTETPECLSKTLVLGLRRTPLLSYPKTYPITWPPWSTPSTGLTTLLPQGILRGSPPHLDKPLAPRPSSEGLVTPTVSHTHRLSRTPASAQGPSALRRP